MAAQRLPRGIWVLGLVSMCMDVSSEMIHSLLPVFMVASLGASALAVGVVEGIAEATALIVKVFSGALSDRLGRRKGVAVFGYALGAASKPLFALAGTIGWVLGARFLDRIGKGIRVAPRDALIADLVPSAIRGSAFGLRQSLDTIGAFVGPLLGILLMLALAGEFRAVFWFAVLPAVLSVTLFAFGVSEPERAPGAAAPADPFRWRTLGELGGACWFVVGLGAVFTLARFSEAFLILRAREFGLPDAYAPAVLIVMNVVYAGLAYPFGKLADRMSHGRLLAWGLAVLVVADLVLALAGNLALVALGVAAWGLHMAMTQGLLAAMVADAAPARLRGTAYGLFGVASGVAMLLSSVIAGLLWDRAGAAATFYAGAAFCVGTLALLAFTSRPAPAAGR